MEQEKDCTVIEYPTKFNKYRRLKEKQALSQFQSSAGDQTMMPDSSVMSKRAMTPSRTLTPTNVPMPISASFIVETETRVSLNQVSSAVPTTSTLHSPFAASGLCQRSIDYCYRPNYATHSVTNRCLLGNVKNDEAMEEDCELPLNLTTSSAKNYEQNQIQPNRISSSQRTATCGSNSTSSYVRPETQGFVENMIIEEHFKRSLGSSYLKLFERPSPQSSPSSDLVSSPKSISQSNSSSSSNSGSSIRTSNSGSSRNGTDEMNSISGSVDDHFSKSLGDVWTKVKANHLPKELDLLPSSVDDHFAKALGEMWYKIQAEKDSSHSLHSNSPHLSPKSSQTSTSFIHS